MMNGIKRILCILILCSISFGGQSQSTAKGNLRTLSSHDVFFSNSKNKKEVIKTLNNGPRQQSRLFGDRVGNTFQPKILLESLIANLDKVNISDACKDDMNTFYKDIGGYLDEESSYANHMLDAWGVAPQGGILDGNWRYPGRYYECKKDYGGPVRGQWCRASYGRRYEKYVIGYPVDFTQGMCFPQVCNVDELHNLMFETLSRDINVPAQKNFVDNNGTFLVDLSCPALDTSWSTTDIIGLVVVTILITLVIFGTIVDAHSRIVKDDDHKVQLQKSSSVLMSFSIISNTESICSLNKPKPGSVVPILDGLRFFSTCWVILGHGLSEMTSYVDNFGSTSYLLDEFTIMGIVSGTYSVDTFFFIGGLLVCFLGMKFITKRKGYGLFDIPLMYLQRYIRLTPPYAFTLLMVLGLYKYLGAGPQWAEYVERQVEVCEPTWWTNLLYINTWFVLGCMGWTWYLSVDWVFYILSPFIILLLYKNRRIGLTVMFILFAGCIATNGYLTKTYDIPMVTQIAPYFSPLLRIFVRVENVPVELTPVTVDDIKTDVYFYPWNRIHVYMIGMATGYVLFITKMKIKMSKLMISTGWTICSGLALTLIYGYYAHKPVLTPLESIDVTAAFNALNRPAWGLCLSWIVIACSCDYGGYITSFLDWPVFMPLSRLTYSAYLVHFYVLQWYFAIQDEPLRWSTMNFAYYFIGCLTITFMVAYVLAVLVEWPTIGLIKLMFPKAKSKSEDQAVNVDVKSNEIEELRSLPSESSKPPSYRSSPSASPDVSKKTFDDITPDKKGEHNKAFEKDVVTLL